MKKEKSLSELFEQARMAEQAYAASLSRAEEQASGALDHWAPKATLVQIGIWQRRSADNIQAALRNGEFNKYDDYLKWNDQDFEANRSLSWEACLEKAADGRKALLELFESFSEADLETNLRAVLDELQRAKPAAAKGRYMKKISISTTMGPGVKIDPNRLKPAAE